MQKLNVLIIPGYRLFPIDSGGAHGQLVFLEKQQQEHNVDMVVTPENLPAAYHNEFVKKFPLVTLIKLGYKKASFFSKLNHSINKTYRKLSRKDFAYKFRKTRYFNNLVINNAPLIEAIQEVANQKEYDLIQVDHTINLGLIEVLPAKPIKVFVHHEISHTRIQSDLEAIGYSKTYASYITSVAEAIELNWLKKYDGVITFCKEDKDLLVQKGVESSIQVARPFALFDDEVINIFDPLPIPEIVFIGGETHFPNKDGLTWFLQEIYPLIKQKRNDVRLLITGHWTDEFKKIYKSDNSIQFVGFVDELSAVLKTGVLAIPIRIGSGIRVKAITAFGNGVPIVSTSLGISGIPGLQHNENVMIADEPSLFSAGIVNLLEQPHLRKKLSDNAFELAQFEFGQSLFAKERGSFYHELVASQKAK